MRVDLAWFMVMRLVLRLALRFEMRIIAIGQKCGAMDIEQHQRARAACQIVDRLLQPWRQGWTHPDHKIGRIQRRRLGGTHIVPMWRGGGRHDQRWRADFAENLRNQRMHWRNIGGHFRGSSQRCPAEADEHGRNQYELPHPICLSLPSDGGPVCCAPSRGQGSREQVMDEFFTTWSGPERRRRLLFTFREHAKAAPLAVHLSIAEGSFACPTASNPSPGLSA